MTDIRRGFHEELTDLNAAVVEQAALASKAIDKGTKAFLNADLDTAERVIAEDREIDKLTWSIEDRVIQLLATQQPMAIDLRTLVTIIRVIHEVERTGDNMVNVVKAARRLYPYELQPQVAGLIERMGAQAVVQLQTAVRAFEERDPAQAAALEDMDDVMDDLQKQLFRWIFANSKEDEEDLIQRAVQVALVGRYYERVADHAVNFGQRVSYMVTGTMPDEDEFTDSTAKAR